MNSRRNLIAGGLVLWLGLTGGAIAQENTATAGKAAARIQASGTLVVRIAVETALPDGSTVSASISAQPSDATYENGSQTSASATVSGGKARLSVRLPYSWRVSSPSDQVSISAGVSGFANVSAVTYQNSTSFSSQFPLPAAGVTTTLNYSGTL